MKNSLKNILRKLIKPKNEPLINIEISRSALLHNFESFRQIKPENIVAPVLKSNAYGHGLIEVARILKNKAELFIVDSYFEAEALRNNGIKNQLIVIGFTRPKTIENSRLKNIIFTVTSLEALYSINYPTKINLKIDTGMHRQGILPEEIDAAFKYMKHSGKISLEGICSHFSDSDNQDNTFTLKQIEIWNKIVAKTKNEFPNIKYIHISNTYGHQYARIIEANTSRLGIGLYGLAEIEGLNLKPVLEMNTIITSIKNIKKGETVGYNNTYEAPQDMKIATIPVGYFEGFNRRLSNKGFVKINEKFAPIIGRVSMNISTIDVSGIENLKLEDKVNVISSNTMDKNSICYMTKLVDTITYELVIKIPQQLKRVVVD